jgi:hypothetical protein
MKNDDSMWPKQSIRFCLVCFGLPSQTLSKEMLLAVLAKAKYQSNQSLNSCVIINPCLPASKMPIPTLPNDLLRMLAR